VLESRLAAAEEEPKLVQFTMYLDQIDLDRVMIAAKKRRLTRTGFIRQAILDALPPEVD
jgi:hypothetical protein